MCAPNPRNKADTMANRPSKAIRIPMRCAFEWRLPLSVRRLRGHCFRKRSPLAHSSARVGRVAKAGIFLNAIIWACCRSVVTSFMSYRVSAHGRNNILLLFGCEKLRKGVNLAPV